MLIATYRRPLGDPDPATANLALAVVLLIVIVIQAIFNAWQDFTMSHTMNSITAMLPLDILVIQDGHTLKVPAPELVLGDIVHVTIGCKIPADLQLVNISSDLKFNRSILTGECNAVPATVESTNPSFMESLNIALQGTLCVGGNGLGVYVLAIVIILWAGWLHYKFLDFISILVLLIDLVSVTVAFIPEGLPIAVTLLLIVILISFPPELTGTLTLNKMTMVNIAVRDKLLTASEARMATVSNGPTSEYVKILAAIVRICNNTHFEMENKELPVEIWKVHGDATGVYILYMVLTFTLIWKTSRYWSALVFREHYAYRGQLSCMG
ncbi:E1-E2 ATPase-domain-containing protein [Armillaria mellea]|nr:E1-E2 ATPase-domain-containing protein [Armillaria mellea]